MAHQQIRPQYSITNKAHTLSVLSNLLHKSYVAELYTFTQQEWICKKDTIIADIKNKFYGRTIIVRSSALREDTIHCSNTGIFRSVLDINSHDNQLVLESIESVLASYREKNAEHPDNLILIQTQILDAILSGTLLTRDYNGSPYYIINYSKEDTVDVTSGRNSQSIKILRSESIEIPQKFRGLINAVSLSDAIEAIASAGMDLGFTREDVSNLDISTIKETRYKNTELIQSKWASIISQNKLDHMLNSYLSLPPVIFSENDLEVVAYYECRPNYVTNKKVIGDIVWLNGTVERNINGLVVVIESADPGYDWIFSKKPIALITKYGGPASHMAIRCAELGLPAIIGVGEMLYRSLFYMTSVKIDCENQRIESTSRVLC